MGFGEAFGFKSPSEVFAEHAALSAFENDGKRDFDIGAFASISEADFENLEPMQWPRPTASDTRARLLQTESSLPPIAGPLCFSDDGRFAPNERSFSHYAQHGARSRSLAYVDADGEKPTALPSIMASLLLKFTRRMPRRHKIKDADLVRVSTGSAFILGARTSSRRASSRARFSFRCTGLISSLRRLASILWRRPSWTPFLGACIEERSPFGWDVQRRDVWFRGSRHSKARDHQCRASGARKM